MDLPDDWFSTVAVVSWASRNVFGAADASGAVVAGLRVNDDDGELMFDFAAGMCDRVVMVA